MAYNLQSEQPSGNLTGTLALLLMALSLVIWFSFELIGALRTKGSLEQALTKQKPQVKKSVEIQQTLSALASATKQLANQGNANAGAIVSNLASRGINIAEPPALQIKQVQP